MADFNDPLSGPVIRTPEAAPLQGQTELYLTGLAGKFTAAGVGSFGASLIAKAVPGGEDNQFLSHDDAVAQLKAAGPGFDTSVIPKDGIYQSGLSAIKTQQQVINNASDAAQRSGAASGVGSFVAGLVGGATDPLFLALGPLGKVGEGAGLATRGVAGAAEGGAVMGGYTEAQKHLGTAPGDRDITSYDVLRQTAVGMVIGAPVKMAFGARPLDADTTAKLEGSSIVAKRQNISVDDVVSPTGAVGKFQIEPATARSYMGADFDVSTLHDPDVNAHVNQVILDDLQKRFPDDIEAQAVAYNAGPGRAKAWIAAGRNDAILPQETQGYLARLRSFRDENPVAAAASLPPEVRDAAMTTAVAQVAQDSEVNVDPVIQNGAAEKAQADAQKAADLGYQQTQPEDNGPVPPLADAAPKPGSALMNERLTAAMLEQVNEAAKTPVAEPSATGENPELAEVNKQAADAAAVAEHAHAMAFGEPEGRTIGAKELGFEEKISPDGSTYLDGDLAAAGTTLRAHADAALAQGREVILHTEGKEIPITQPGMKDANGNKWGAAAILQSKKGFAAAKLEIKPAPSAFKQIMAEHEEDAAKGDELANAVDAAVRCGALKGFE